MRAWRAKRGILRLHLPQQDAPSAPRRPRECASGVGGGAFFTGGGGGGGGATVRRVRDDAAEHAADLAAGAAAGHAADHAGDAGRSAAVCESSSMIATLSGNRLGLRQHARVELFRDHLLRTMTSTGGRRRRGRRGRRHEESRQLSQRDLVVVQQRNQQRDRQSSSIWKPERYRLPSRTSSSGSRLLHQTLFKHASVTSLGGSPAESYHLRRPSAPGLHVSRPDSGSRARPTAAAPRQPRFCHHSKIGLAMKIDE